jgi:hypothetical protein
MNEKSESNHLEEDLARLQLVQRRFLGLATRFREHASGGFDPMALFSYAALKRTLFLLDGFTHMIDDRNFVCAGALLRVQLDTALRFHAVFLVKDPRKFGESVLTGTKVSALLDREGHKLTDRHLAGRAATEFTWVTSVYEQASGYVHFSEKHLLSHQSAVEASAQSALSEINISSFDEVSDSSLREAVMAFAKAAELVDLYVSRWSETDRSARAAV